MPRFYSWDKIISKAECESLIATCLNNNKEIARVGDGNGGSAIVDHRKTNIHWVDGTKLISKLIYGFIHEANDVFFHYDITNHEEMQFGEYSVGDYYKYHQDTMFSKESGELVSPNRKLSASILLNDPQDFEGGDFVMYDGDSEVLKPLNGQGSVLVFDSSDFHKVEAVTSGVRYSLVMWATGPIFK
jgi:PKHD-type hydroxylase